MLEQAAAQAGRARRPLRREDGGARPRPSSSGAGRRDAKREAPTPSSPSPARRVCASLSPPASSAPTAERSHTRPTLRARLPLQNEKPRESGAWSVVSVPTETFMKAVASRHKRLTDT